MVTGAPGEDGPPVRGPVAVGLRQGAEHALIQPLRTEAVSVKGPQLSRYLVTLHHAKVL